MVRNDQVTKEAIEKWAPEAIVISPGPGSPADAGYSVQCVRDFADTIPILGVCLGHQAIVSAFGGQIVRSEQPMHGRCSDVHHLGGKFFADVPTVFSVGRYHSLIAQPLSWPDCLEVTARLEDDTIMAIGHRSLPVVGVQFHPESILTDNGYQLLENFCSLAGIEIAK